jgi:hypothetical protein
MTKKSLPKQYAEALICPSCGAERLIPTKEKIIICQACFTGFRVNEGVPDFRLEYSISFRNKVSAKRKGLQATLTVLMGDDKTDQADVKFGHCLILGRKVNPNQSIDMTVVMKPASQKTFSKLDPHNQHLIEKYLSRSQGEHFTPEQRQAFSAQNKFVGNFMRDPDFLLNDPSISRAHAVIYQDTNGINLLDLYSKNGTYVNGYEVESCRLRNNDLVSLGTASLRISLY